MNKKDLPEQPKNTSELDQELGSSPDLGLFLKNNQHSFIQADIGKALSELIKKKDRSKASVAREAQMNEIYLFQILSGRRTPSRDRLLCLSFSLGCTLAETQELLKQARLFPLYVKDRRDAILIYGLENGWNLSRVNDNLSRSGEKALI